MAAEEINKADELYKENKFVEVYDYLTPFKESTDPNLLWRLARATLDRASVKGIKKDDKKKLVFDGLEVAKKALELGDDNYNCHSWYGILLTEANEFIGSKKQIEDSKEIREHFERAIELCPTDALSHHLMGVWNFSFADLAWYERKIAAVVFGKPPETTFEEAYKFFKKAEDLEPSFYSENQYMLGLSSLKMGNKPEAKEWFTKLLEFKVVCDDDTAVIKKAQDELKSL